MVWAEIDFHDFSISGFSDFCKGKLEIFPEVEFVYLAKTTSKVLTFCDQYDIYINFCSKFRYRGQKSPFSFERSLKGEEQCSNKTALTGEKSPKKRAFSHHAGSSPGDWSDSTQILSASNVRSAGGISSTTTLIGWVSSGMSRAISPSTPEICKRAHDEIHSSLSPPENSSPGRLFISLSLSLSVGYFHRKLCRIIHSA